MAKCTQCGDCCSNEVCLIGEKLFETTETPCPALQHFDDKFWCGVVLHSGIIHKDLPSLIQEALGIGVGCCSSYGDICMELHKDNG